jgi:hypothetical protein
MHRLAKDAQKWAELRRILQDQIRGARKFVADYCQCYNANQTPKDVQQLDEFEINVNNRIRELDQTVRDLLQIVRIVDCFYTLSKLILYRSLPGPQSPRAESQPGWDRMSCYSHTSASSTYRWHSVR